MPGRKGKPSVFDSVASTNGNVAAKVEPANGSSAATETPNPVLPQGGSGTAPAAPPSYASNIEYRGVPNDRLLFAVYDAEKQQRNHTDAVHVLSDEVKQLHVEIENLADNVSKLEEVNKELLAAIKELRARRSQQGIVSSD